MLNYGNTDEWSMFSQPLAAMQGVQQQAATAPGLFGGTGGMSLAPQGGGGGGGASPFSSLGLFGGTDADGNQVNGWAGSAIGLGQGLLGAYMGMKQYGLAKDALKQSKAQFEKNYAAQRQMTNSRLEDRQRARVASNPDAYQSVSGYMDKYGVK
ncbi:hypothetical protein [Larsenimonas suaedae]|uniref:Uncharacterized protein n=1 Tax=Larsenimonas suaedae TaxID=1851019 RepID=A0ABU1GZ66_9GAMM|nr:hypothetical protein [Larsenimonas suaedae]MCM2973725.1 hypothetical protein [Larsenimonas suaedae]MDR5897334.1 hypothetical protein [Larsenimonas suaedae]